ncbi:hypothetical protein ACMA1I_16185 [Pontibacter sp. 13R65]|uniref:hypothetical protein n=1 Tax=Pontibacter sp. 13R65 TaxID=3127458 RepID=UPI00301BEB9D
MADITFVFLLLVVLVVLVRPITALFHEVGHAIPAMLITRQNVTVFIGSYGDKRKGIRLHMGLLEIWFRYNFFAWQIGLCTYPAKDVSVKSRILIILAGPLASSLIALTACYLTFVMDLHGAIKLILVVFLGCALFDLVVNLVPSKTPFKLFNGDIAYNDGYRLKQLLRQNSLPKAYAAAVEEYNRKNFKEASGQVSKLIANGLKEEQAFRIAISAYTQVNDYDAAKGMVEEFSLLHEMNAEDCGSAGLVYCQLELYTEGLEYFKRSLQLDADNKYTLNNMGYTLNLLGRYEEATLILSRAIEVDGTFADAYSNRGLSKFQLGMDAEGMLNIKRCFELDPDNSYGYRNLGIYHLEKKEYGEALPLFRKAKELDINTHLIDLLIQQAASPIHADSSN